MGNTTQTYLDRYRHDHRARRRTLGVLFVLAAIVAVGVAWGLRSTGIAMTNEVTCGLEEHTHTDECYDDEGNLTCGLEEHTHTVDCLGESGDGEAEEANDGEATVTEAAAYADAATYEATDEASGVSVTVDVPDGALPEGAELSVTLLDESSDEYAEAADAVSYDAADESTGMAALDIKFTVGGEEVEPSEAVVVSIDASALVPDGATDLAVTHLDESDGSVEPVLVADATDGTDGTVDESAATAEFEVASFSTFTITWSGNGNTTYFTITVHYVDESSKEIAASTSSQTVSISGSNGSSKYNFSDYAATIDGYTYSKATYNDSEVTTATFESSQTGSGMNRTTTRTLTLSNSSGTSVYSTSYDNSTVSVDVYLVYKKTGVTLTATAALVGTGEKLDGVGSLTVSYGTTLDLTSSNGDLALSDYTLSYATLTYGDETVTATSVTVTKAEDGSTYTVTYEDANGATQTLASGLTDEQAASVEVTLWYAEVPSVTITYVKSGDSSYKLTATPSGFTGDDVAYEWECASSSDYTLTNNGDGTATLTWTDGIKVNSASTLTASVSVTATSASTGETATDSTTVSNAVIAVYVFVAGSDLSGNTFSSDMLTLLNVNTLDSSGYFAAGVIYLDMSQFSGSASSMIQTDAEWDYVIGVLKSSLVTSYSTTSSGNLIAQYADQVIRDLNASQGIMYSGLWTASTHSNLSDAGGEVSSDGTPTSGTGIYWHLDLRFETVTITYIYGNNDLSSDNTTAGSKVFIKGATMDYEPTITVPSGYKFAGYYADPDFKTPWSAIGQPITEDTTVYIKLVPEDEKVLYYKVAEGEGTLSSYSEGVKESATTAVGSTATADDGYEFDGWYADAECTQLLSDDPNYVPTRPTNGWVDGTTYYAKFVPISYSVTISKVDSKVNDDGSYTTLDGAKFRLYKTETTTVDGVETTTTYYYSCDDSGNVTWVTDPESATTVTTDSNGSAKFDSLSIGTYYLEEVSAPDGYNRLSSSIEIKVNADNTITVSDDNASSNGLTLTVFNHAGTTLPNTGGTGTTLLTLAGAALVGASACVARRRLRREGRCG